MTYIYIKPYDSDSIAPFALSTLALPFVLLLGLGLGISLIEASRSANKKVSVFGIALTILCVVGVIPLLPMVPILLI